VDETAFLAATGAHPTEFATGIVALTGDAGVPFTRGYLSKLSYLKNLRHCSSCRLGQAPPRLCCFILVTRRIRSWAPGGSCRVGYRGR
jgi:hypothetical protein